jgi:hypothetical protein
MLADFDPLVTGIAAQPFVLASADGPCPPPADTPDPSATVTTQQVTA